MKRLQAFIYRAVKWKARNGLMLLRISLGIVFFWFGFLKFFPGYSSAEEIAGKTILRISFGFVKPGFSMPFLACWECFIGIGFLTKKFIPVILGLMYLQMVGTLLPLVLFPSETWEHQFVPTLLGQYIIKNFVLISGGIVLGSTIYGGSIIVNHSEAINIADKYK